MPWTQLIQLALLGAERAQPGPELSAELTARGVDMSAPLSQVILEGAVLWRQISRVGFPAAAYAYALPAGFDAAAERPCPPQAARTLGRILEGSYAPALEEWLLLLARHNYHLPAECLPLLFDRCVTQPALWPQVRAVIGPRGEWLAPQNPAWRPVFGNPVVTCWETAPTRAERQAVLVYLRQNDPDQARQLLESSWKSESPADRHIFLKTLEAGLSLADEPFLESCLDDSRKETRQAAALLLASLPDSTLSQRLWENGKSWLTFSLTGKAQFKIPAKLPEDMQRDGIGPAGDKGMDWLLQLLARVPPARWEAHFGLSPEAIYTRLSPQATDDPLGEAIQEAVCRHRETRWATAILACWLKDNAAYFKMTPTKSRLLQLVPHAEFSKLAFEAVQESGAPLPERSAIYPLLTQPGRFWDDKLTMAVVTGFQQVIASSKSYGWHLWHYKQLLESAAYACRPSLHDALQKGWPFSSPVWRNWESEVEQLFRVVDFRRRMREELGEGARG